jgi:hypothetical protein
MNVECNKKGAINASPTVKWSAIYATPVAGFAVTSSEPKFILTQPAHILQGLLPVINQIFIRN